MYFFFFFFFFFFCSQRKNGLIHVGPLRGQNKYMFFTMKIEGDGWDHLKASLSSTRFSPPPTLAPPPQPHPPTRFPDPPDNLLLTVQRRTFIVVLLLNALLCFIYIFFSHRNVFLLTIMSVKDIQPSLGNMVATFLRTDCQLCLPTVLLFEVVFVKCVCIRRT